MSFDGMGVFSCRLSLSGVRSLVHTSLVALLKTIPKPSMLIPTSLIQSLLTGGLREQSPVSKIRQV